jgi:hypothetical protein
MVSISKSYQASNQQKNDTIILLKHGNFALGLSLESLSLVLKTSLAGDKDKKNAEGANETCSITSTLPKSKHSLQQKFTTLFSPNLNALPFSAK